MWWLVGIMIWTVLLLTILSLCHIAAIADENMQEACREASDLPRPQLAVSLRTAAPSRLPEPSPKVFPSEPRLSPSH